MTARTTAKSSCLTERNKARARLVLLLLLTALLPPLAGARSALVWVFYIAFAVLYSLWSMRLVRVFGQDRRLGYLLCVTDIAVLLPLLVWTSSPFVQTALIVLCAAGLLFTYASDRARVKAASRARNLPTPGSGTSTSQTGVEEVRASSPGEALLRHLDRRIRLFEATGQRFAVVLLRVLRLNELQIYYGQEEADRTINVLERRGLRLLGPDAKCFFLAGGRMAFVFALTGELPLVREMVAREMVAREAGPGKMGSGNAGRRGALEGGSSPRHAVPTAPLPSIVYDVEGAAMKLARLVCERSVDGHRVACSVGWASCPADGITAEDLLYVADAGARSPDVFRQVGTAPVAATPPGRRAAV